MCELFLFSSFDTLLYLGRVGVFILILSLITFCTVACLCLAIFKSGYSLKKRAWLFFCYGGLMAFEWWAESLIEEDYSYIFLTVSVCFIFCALLLLIPEKAVKIKREQLELARFFDSQVKAINQPIVNEKYLIESKSEPSNCQDLLNKVEKKNNISTVKAQTSDEKRTKPNQEIDFLNVKTILNKLDYYSISTQDKVIAKELESAIISAEKYGVDDNLKDKINDGLGALLKIMSKYAI